jgi:hypothetical protein
MENKGLSDEAAGAPAEAFQFGPNMSKSGIKLGHRVSRLSHQLEWELTT